MAMRQIGLIILLFFTSLAYAQNVEFKASAPSVVAVGEQFKLEYTLNKEGDNLKVPTLEGFDLLMGPSVGQSFYSSNINGKMTQNVTFSYTFSDSRSDSDYRWKRIYIQCSENRGRRR